MKAVIAIDSFKGSLTSLEAGNAVKDGIEDSKSGIEARVFPLADGGEGTAFAITSANGGKTVKKEVSNPLGEKREASYGFIPETKTAVIEIAEAAGITLIDKEKRNPLNTTTYGVGELIKDAIQKGCRRFIIGLGGSVTNDGGIGMLSALGFEFFDKDKNAVELSGKGLEKIVGIDAKNALKELKDCTFFAACDVQNPLCGENGCSAVYGPQKGATEETAGKMDLWLKNYAKLTKEIFPDSDDNRPGCGAAGGLGFAFVSYLNAELVSGIDLVIKETALEEYIKEADIVVTGEGKLDFQSHMGKAPIGVAKTAKKYGKKVIAFSGSVEDGAQICNEHGIDAFFSAVKSPCTLEEAMNSENAYRNLRDTACQVFRLLSLKN